MLLVAAGVFFAACTEDPDPAPPLKNEGEACAVSTECGPGLACLGDVCTAGTCRSAAECSGDPGNGCSFWACVRSRCEPGCSMGAPDASTPPDSAIADTGGLPDAADPRDAGFRDAEPDDTGAALDAEPDDSGVVLDAEPGDTGGDPDAAAADAGGGCIATPRPPQAGELLINELHAAPAIDLTGDANGDGTRDAADDELIEIANISGQTLLLTGVVVSDATSVRYTFGAVTLSCGQAIALFGGGNPGAPSWRSNWLAAGGNGLSLNNGGDTVSLGSSAAMTSDLASVTFGGDVSGRSIVRETDLSPAAPFVAHDTAAGAAGRLFSPGVRTDGTEF